MMTSGECRKLALSFRDRACEAQISAKKATILKNVARSYSGLAHQLEMLDSCVREERSQIRSHDVPCNLLT